MSNNDFIHPEILERPETVQTKDDIIQWLTEQCGETDGLGFPWEDLKEDGNLNPWDHLPEDALQKIVKVGSKCYDKYSARELYMTLYKNHSEAEKYRENYLRGIFNGSMPKLIQATQFDPIPVENVDTINFDIFKPENPKQTLFLNRLPENIAELFENTSNPENLKLKKNVPASINPNSIRPLRSAQWNGQQKYEELVQKLTELQRSFKDEFEKQNFQGVCSILIKCITIHDTIFRVVPYYTPNKVTMYGTHARKRFPATTSTITPFRVGIDFRTGRKEDKILTNDSGQMLYLRTLTGILLFVFQHFHDLGREANSIENKDIVEQLFRTVFYSLGFSTFDFVTVMHHIEVFKNRVNDIFGTNFVQIECANPKKERCGRAIQASACKESPDTFTIFFFDVDESAEPNVVKQANIYENPKCGGRRRKTLKKRGHKKQRKTRSKSRTK
jgi:hypothetical protein